MTFNKRQLRTLKMALRLAIEWNVSLLDAIHGTDKDYARELRGENVRFLNLVRKLDSEVTI